MLVLTLAAGLLAAPAPPAAATPPVTASAQMGSALIPGATAAFTVTVDVADGWSALTAGVPGIFIQLDVPEALTLEGEVLEGRRALARNGFLMAPYERLVKPGTTEITFTLDRTPAAGEALGVNVIAYARSNTDTDTARVVRQRLELPLEPGATGVSGNPADSSWGDQRVGLQIGDTADAFSLPRADGSTITLAEFRGKKNVIVTTYRAHW